VEGGGLREGCEVVRGDGGVVLGGGELGVGWEGRRL
jgi:hypothetical protein